MNKYFENPNKMYTHMNSSQIFIVFVQPFALNANAGRERNTNLPFNGRSVSTMQDEVGLCGV